MKRLWAVNLASVVGKFDGLLRELRLLAQDIRTSLLYEPHLSPDMVLMYGFDVEG